MNYSKLITYVRGKGDFATDQELANFLGVTLAELLKMQKDQTEATELKIANLILKIKSATKKEIHNNAVNPIVEFFAITPTLTRSSKKYEVFSTTDDNLYKIGLKEQLKSIKTGLYIFYDARGKALYAGQTKKQTLWKELNDAYNRDRSEQSAMLVKHPTNNISYKTNDEVRRKLIETPLRLYDLAAYFSAYQADSGLVDNLEALLIRAFPNDLLNVKMQNIKKTK